MLRQLVADKLKILTEKTHKTKQGTIYFDNSDFNHLNDNENIHVLKNNIK